MGRRNNRVKHSLLARKKPSQGHMQERQQKIPNYNGVKMSKALVLYQTTSGYTKKYAQWISEALAADLSEAKNFNTSKLIDYDLIIFGGSLHAVGISGVKIIKENLPRLANKKIVVFAVGASPPREN